MQFTVYIIYSPSIDQFYIGQTSDLEKRLQEHNSHVYSQSFTTRSEDWEVFFTLECVSREQALKIEKHLKSMRKRGYYDHLKNYPEIAIRLKEKYK